MGKYIICMSVKLNHLLLNSILLMDKGIQVCVESTKKFHFFFSNSQLFPNWERLCIFKGKTTKNSSQTFPCLTENHLMYLIKVTFERYYEIEEGAASLQ